MYEFELMAEGYKELSDINDKKEWYHTRQVCWMIYLANADPKKAAKTIDDFMPIGERPKAKRVSNKYIQDAVKKLNERLGSQ